MIRTAVIAVLALVALASNAEASQRHKPTGLHPMCNILWPCIAPSASTPEQARMTRGRYIANQVGFGGPVLKRAVRVSKGRPVSSGFAKSAKKSAAEVPSFGVPSPSIARTISGIVAPLAAKVAEIQSSCGSKVISAIRHTYVAGTHRISQHANGTAVDMSGNPSCIYSLLHGWAGGYSTDYSAVRHVHISYGGREHGIRFVHGGHRTRHAHHRHHRQRWARAQ